MYINNCRTSAEHTSYALFHREFRQTLLDQIDQHVSGQDPEHLVDLLLQLLLQRRLVYHRDLTKQ